MEQIDRAGQGRDTNALKTLGAKANGLAQQLGPDYVRIMDGLNDVDPNSAVFGRCQGSGTLRYRL